MENNRIQISRRNLTKTNKLRVRLIVAQSQLPSRINFDLYEFHFGKLKASEKIKVQNVWLFKATDEKITKNFELMSKKQK